MKRQRENASAQSCDLVHVYILFFLFVYLFAHYVVAMMELI